MSKSVAKQTSKSLVWVLMLLLILGLGGFGVSNFGGSIDSIGTVGDRKISIDTYGRALQQELAAQQSATGERMSLAEAEARGIVASVRGRVIGDAAMDNELARLGVSVGDERVAERVRDFPAFKGPDGTFSRDTYAYVLKNNGLTESAFEDRVRDDTARSLLQAAVVGGLGQPDTYARTIYAFLAERRSANLVELTGENLPTPVGEPDEAAIQAQYEATPAAYTAPRIRKITYAWLTPDMMLDRIEPDEEVLRQLYEDRIDEFVQPERRLVERLVFPDGASAATAMEAIVAGETTFEDAVADRGLSMMDVDMGDVTEVEIGGDAGRAVFALNEPGITGPHLSDLGPAIFRVNAILAAQETPFEDAREALAEEAARDRAIRVIGDQITDLDDLLAAGATLEELGTETKMEVGQIDFTADSDEGIAAYDDFRAAAESAAEGDFPEILELEDGGIFALRLDAEIPPALRPLADVREQVIADWRAAETGRRLTEMAEAMKAELDAGKFIDALGVPFEFETGLARGSLTPPELNGALFGLSDLGDSTVATIGDRVWLIRLLEIMPPDPNDPNAAFLLENLTGQAAQSIAGDLYAYFTQALINDAGLNLDQSAINAVHANFR
ncbi:Peptidyl-prolyl cis-trans isomerase PpiD [Rhodovulum sp. P5]|uniref:peptidylprolyl isomerase n=1 Tax=Rhodovulum sp. P5 TaxID=1564506 RepID=UPI0009C38DBD|nr:peptidylprolyl isomerase [Rhodovulum sp. P5]ARE39634.1 Peptidyl-prolyl cis-trans isomerase PpiD [Rhodovulum sp. P5]